MCFFFRYRLLDSKSQKQSPISRIKVLLLKKQTFLIFVNLLIQKTYVKFFHGNNPIEKVHPFFNLILFDKKAYVINSKLGSLRTTQNTNIK